MPRGVSDVYMDRITTDHENVTWKVFARAGSMVEAIKRFRADTGAGLYEAKVVVETYADARKQAEAAGSVTTRTIQLPGAVLNVISNGTFSAIQYTRTEAVNISDADLPQAIADAVMRHLHENPVA